MESDYVVRARQGDEEAYEFLVRQHQDAVFRLAYLFVGDVDEADDIAQEAFIRAFRSLAGFDTTRPLRPWLLRITANIALNRRRSVDRYLAALRRLILIPEIALNPEVESTRRWEAQTLWQAVRRLGAADQEVIYLRYFLELSVHETAEILGVEAGTVKSRLSRALERLRAVVKQDFPLLYEGRLQ